MATKFLNISTDNTLGGNSPSDTTVSSQKAIKEYIDNQSESGGYHPGLFAHEWDDHLRNDVQWLRADTFSWQDGSVYEAAYKELLQDMYIKAQWAAGGSIAYTRYRFPEVGQMVYSNSAMTTEIGAITETDGSTYIVANNTTYSYQTGGIDSYNETIAGTTISYALSSTGRKVVFSQYESNVAAIYAATGVAWYYIVDTANTRFKLPRTQYNEVGLRDTVGKYVPETSPNITGWIKGGITENSNPQAGGAFSINSTYNSDDKVGNPGWNSKGVDFDASRSSSTYQDGAPVQQRATQMYLYFYVGSFTQTALENTAGITAETLNGKVDKGHQLIGFQEPTAANSYTWYRKYADGWVEQGGFATSSESGTTCNFPITMANNKYTAQVTVVDQGSSNYSTAVRERATTYIKISTYNESRTCSWFVCGMAA